MRAKRTCFLICPISKPGDQVNQRSWKLLENIIIPAVEPFGFSVHHFLEPYYSAGQESIRELMMNWLKTADICIADLTDDNPNVFFEYGLRRSTGRPVLAFIKSGRKLPFDVSDYHTPPYNFDKPQEAVRNIQEFLAQRGFDMPLVHVTAERGSQSTFIREYIQRAPARRINVLQFSLLSVSRELFDACWLTPDLTVAILLMHPDCVKNYAGSDGHIRNIRDTEASIKRIPETTKLYKYKEPTLGLWYYRHEPSVAAVMIGDEFVQLGWYFREPDPQSANLLRLKGHNQPSIIAEGGEAKKLIPKVRQHFEELWRSAELVCISGPNRGKLEREWQQLRNRPAPAEVNDGTRPMPQADSEHTVSDGVLATPRQA